MSTEKRLTLSWRIGLGYCESDEAFGQLLMEFKNYRTIVDEVALFDTITHHLYIPLDVYAPRMELIGARMDAFREAGVSSAGINVLCTIGHLNEAWSSMPSLPFQCMVGHDGSVSTGCACPNTPEMRNYVRAKYRLAAQARPDFIWVDDDIRMQHHGVAWGCFCPTCLRLFAEKAGEPHTREKLVGDLSDPGQNALRRLWVQQNIDSIDSLLADVAAAVHEVDPEIVTGLMTAGAGWTTYSGMAFDRWFKTLKAVKARPGGGFYSDATPIQMYHKAVECGRQRAILPPEVTDVQYELENFPYQLLKKSSAAVVDECTLALAYGMNGVAFNMLALAHSLEDSTPLMAQISAARPMWEGLVAHADGLPTAGLWSAWSTHLASSRTIRKNEDWFGGWDPRYDICKPFVLGEIGLPIAVDFPAFGTILCGRVAEAFDDDQLETILSGGVLMDSTALDVLTERGMGRLAGVRVAERFDNGLMERFSDDAMNGSAAGQIRDARIEFWGDARGMGDMLEPAGDGVRVLTTMEDYLYRPRGPGMTAFENELGGRVVVMGYAPWIFLHSVGKRMQLQNAADWITRGGMPVRIDETAPLIPIARLSTDRRKGAIVLLNAGMDEIPAATVRLRSDADNARLLAPGQRNRELELLSDESDQYIVLHNLQPWSIVTVLLD